MGDNPACEIDLNDVGMQKVCLHTANNDSSNRNLQVFHISGNSNKNDNKSATTTCPLTHLPKRTAVDIEFQDVGYSVHDPSIKGSKTLIKNLTGKFKSGELAAIMGPSGAGKTTFMDILAGYKTNGLTGKILINKKLRCLSSFRKLSCYIMQAGELLQQLTVLESMVISTNLKIGRSTSEKDKKLLVNEILETLGLTECKHTRCCHLSGGQKKRLLIALELVNNPPIMFLDEPTSGLDSSSSVQCISLLKSLSHGGRTIICTIHQPSARLFEMFDQIYTLSNGQCIYKGPVNNLVPFLGSQGLHCPSFHNPADFMMEVAIGDHGDVQNMLTTSILSEILKYDADEIIHDKLKSKTNGNCSTGNEKQSLGSPQLSYFRSKEYISSDVHDSTPSTFYQFTILLKRTITSTFRDQTLTQLRILSHVIVGILIGILYYGVGDDAAEITNNSGCLFFTILFLMFSSMMPTILTFPLEMSVLIREHLNHWYTTKPYYLAKTSADIPFQVLFTVAYVVIVYYLTNQPMEWFRFSIFMLVCILTSLVAQSIGLLVGAALSIENGTYFGPVTAIPCILFSGFFLKLKSIPSCLQWISYFSYIRFGYEGCALAVYGFDRPRLNCSQPYCHFRSPDKYLRELDMDDSLLFRDILLLLTFFVVLRVVTYIVLKWKVNSWN